MSVFARQEVNLVNCKPTAESNIISCVIAPRKKCLVSSNEFSISFGFDVLIYEPNVSEDFRRKY